LRELALSYDRDGRTKDALGAIQRAAALGPGAVSPELVAIVTRAAENADTADEAFALLERTLGAEGVDALLELSKRKDASAATRSRAQKSLAKEEVRAAASPAAAVVLDLGAAKTCQARRAVVVRASQDADSRAVPALKALQSTRGCGRRGRQDCHPCLRKDGALAKAIKAAQARAR
jgi:hypothetical protein